MPSRPWKRRRIERGFITRWLPGQGLPHCLRITIGTETEVKAVRTGRVQLKDSFVDFRDGQAWLIGAHISHYTHGNRENHEPEAPRKLLLKKRQIDKFFGRTQLKGLTVVPLSVYLKGNWIKLEIALVTGKKEYDKRETEKTRELDREADAAVKTGRW